MSNRSCQRLSFLTDIRYSHYCGVYTIKASTRRFLCSGNPADSIAGEEGVPPVFSPMARTLEDLETFWRAVMSMKPWEYDHTVSTTYLSVEGKG